MRVSRRLSYNGVSGRQAILIKMKNTGKFVHHFHTVFNWAIVYPCFGVMLYGTAIASNSTTDNDVHIETTANELLGEEKAAHFKKMLKPDETISWEVYLPNNDTEEVPGVFVYVSPMKTGRIATQYPDVFTGALYICGVDFWKKDKTPDVDRLLQNRFVFLTGTSDFNRRETRQIQKRYIKAGAQHTKLIIVPGMAHKHPDATYLTEALQFLLDKD